MENFFIEFEVTNKERFKDLSRVFTEIQQDKNADSFRSDEEWLSLFGERALSHFWWPSAEERESHSRLWKQLPVEQRLTDPRLEVPWDFGSMIDAFKDGEYDLIACRMVSENKARLEFNPWAYPFGGTGCMKALIEAFDFQVVRDWDGA